MVYFSLGNLQYVSLTNAYCAFFTKKIVESTISESKPCIIHFVFLTMYFRLCRPVYFSLVNLNDVFYTRLVYVFFTNLFMFFLYFLPVILDYAFYTSFENGKHCILHQIFRKNVQLAYGMNMKNVCTWTQTMHFTLMPRIYFTLWQKARCTLHQFRWRIFHW